MREAYCNYYPRIRYQERNTQRTCMNSWKAKFLIIRIDGSEEKAKESDNAENREKSLQERSNGM